MVDVGFILLARKSVNSDIWNKPPLYWKIWCFILFKAFYEDKGKLKRGELITSMQELQEAGTYYIGFRKEVPTPKQIRSILNYLRNPYEESNECTNEKAMIVTTKVTNGIHIKVVNYGTYQTLENYESNNESNTKVIQRAYDGNSKGETIKKNIKNKRNKEYIYKHKYGKYEHVLLTDEEYEKLNSEYGGLTKELIAFLDEYIEMKGYKAKSHYLCLRKWVYDAVLKEQHKVTYSAKQIETVDEYSAKDNPVVTDEQRKQLLERRKR